MPGTIEHEELLTQAHEGMTVSDVNQELLGTVAAVYFGSSGQHESEPVEAPVVGSIAGAMGTIGGTGNPRDFENEFPKHVRAALSHQGCIKVKGGGVFGPLWYVTPQQIDSVDGEQINLNVPAREVIRSR